MCVTQIKFQNCWICPTTEKKGRSEENQDGYNKTATCLALPKPNKKMGNKQIPVFTSQKEKQNMYGRNGELGTGYVWSVDEKSISTLIQGRSSLELTKMIKFLKPGFG